MSLDEVGAAGLVLLGTAWIRHSSITEKNTFLIFAFFGVLIYLFVQVLFFIVVCRAASSLF